MPAVKADAYGHGAVPVSRALLAAGAERLAVATCNEFRQLRNSGITADILILTPALDRLASLAEQGAIFCVPDATMLDRLQHARVPEGTRVHLKVDTGLGRLGTPPEEAAALARRIDSDPRLVLDGTWSHFASAEDDPELSTRQIAEFNRVLELLRHDGIDPGLRHMSNSAGILNHPEAEYDCVRPGITLYGYGPETEQDHGLPLVPALTLLAPVTFVKRVQEGTGVSYNHLWHASRDTTIATVRCGYADGYRRLLGNRSWAKIRGQRVNVVGRVAMDQLLIDTGDLDVQPGELVTLIGGSGPLASELGQMADTNAYDILTSLTPRVERQYVHAGGQVREH